DKSKIALESQIDDRFFEGLTKRQNTSCKPIINAHNVNVYYQKWHILRDLCFEINPGLIYGVIGKNGAGKSTLLQVLSNLIPYKGRITFKGVNHSKIKVHELAKSIGLIFQNPNHQIFEKTVIDEVFFGPRNFKILDEEIKDRANNNLENSNLYRYKTKTPFGLSFGEKRRLNYISVEIYEPDLLLLDEPFIGQDSNNVIYILERILDRRKKGLTTIVVSHRLDLLRRFVDNFILLDKGKIVWQGPSKNLEEDQIFSILEG
ncbi:MAG: energy-coupling factor ABC transporter ATP-binding protein, partial [Candidatus Hodarchaeales archaeon]